MTLFTRRSLATGRISSMEIPITQTEYDQWVGTSTLIQRAFPNLTPGQREFLISGTTEEEWDEMFGEEEGEEETPNPQELN